MSAKKGKSKPKEHPLSTELNLVHRALWECPSNLQRIEWQGAGSDDADDTVNRRNEYFRSLRELLKANASRLEAESTKSDKVVLGQIARMLMFIADHGVGVGWRFVQLVDYVNTISGHLRSDQPLQEITDKRDILSRGEIYVDEFVELMKGLLADLEKLFLRLSPPVRPEVGSVPDTKVPCAETAPSSDTYVLNGFANRLENIAYCLQHYNGCDEKCREFYVARQVLQLRYDIDEARNLLSLCKNTVDSELFEKTRAVVNGVWGNVEQMRLSLVAALRIKPTNANTMPRFIDKMIDSVSTKIAQTNERRSVLEELAGEFQAAAASAKPVRKSAGRARTKKRKSAGPAQTKKKETIWEDVSPDMKKAIQDYWKESEARKSEGKRLLIEDFCGERDLDEEAFRAEKNRVAGRSKRLQLAC